jgi:hypothetical protein
LVSQIGGPLLSIGSDRELDWASASGAVARHNPTAAPILKLDLPFNKSDSCLCSQQATATPREEIGERSLPVRRYTLPETA